jgi:hypothetical protein
MAPPLEPSRRPGSGFDPRRAWLLRRDLFRPFHVTGTRPLRQALAGGELSRDTPVLALERAGATLVLLRVQMAYHHVAQGEVGGEPWMASF